MIEIIPAIDMMDGKCVRLSQGDFLQKKIYSGNPLEVAKQFEDAGLTRLHLVDLDGARKGEVMNWKALESIAGGTKLAIDFGGGIKTGETMKRVFNCGAAMAAIGTMAVKQPELFFSWLREFGAERILLGADVKHEKIVVSGWTEQSALSVFDFIGSNAFQGVKTIFCTDAAKDGMLEGSSTKLYEKILGMFPRIDLIASGGVASMEDVYELERAGCKGVIIGKAIYEGRISLKQLQHYAG